MNRRDCWATVHGVTKSWTQLSDEHTHIHKPLEWPKSGMLPIPNAGKDLEQEDTLLLFMGMQSGTATVEDSLAVSYQSKHTLTTQTSNGTPWYLSKEVENICPHKKPTHGCL